MAVPFFVVIVCLVIGFAAGYLIWKSQSMISSYVACGCGCCGGTTPVKKCLYHSKGDDLDMIIKKDKAANLTGQCATVGCSLGTEYSYCD